MSSMLEQAIIDASALREAAIQSAEHAVVNKFSDQIKDAVDTLLESESLEEAKTPEAEAEESYGKDQNAPRDKDPTSTVEVQLAEADQEGAAYAFLEGTELSDVDEGEEIELDIENLIAEALEEEGLELEELAEVDEDLLLGKEKKKEKSKKKAKMEEGDDADQELSDDDIKIKNIAKVVVVKDDDEINDDDDVEVELDETITFDYDSVPEGETVAYGQPTKRRRQSKLVIDVLNQVEEYNDQLGKKNKKLKNENKQLKNDLGTSIDKNKKLLESVSEIKTKFEEVSLLNAKLLYTNKVYVDDSLNERQKKNIVESIKKAQTIEQTKIVYETLQSAVGDTFKQKEPKSLSEAVGNRSSSSLLIKAKERKPVEENKNPFADRMKALAGIKNI